MAVSRDEKGEKVYYLSLHGYGILLRIQQEGGRDTAIYRLERRGWIKGEWGASTQTKRSRLRAVVPTAAWSRQSQNTSLARGDGKEVGRKGQPARPPHNHNQNDRSSMSYYI